MRSAIAGCMAGLAALALASAASAATTTFSGKCHVTGIAKFPTPIGGAPKTAKYIFDSGPPSSSAKDETTCTGTLDGAAVSSPAIVHVEGDGSLSCAKSTGKGAAGRVTLTRGTASTADDVTVPFTLDIDGTATEVDLTVHGQREGGGTGHASFANYASPTTPVDCTGATGGVKELGFTADFTTSAPMVSDAPDQPASGATTQGPSNESSSSGETGSSAPLSSAPAPAASNSSTAAAKPKHKKKHKKHRKHKKHKKKKRHH